MVRRFSWNWLSLIRINLPHCKAFALKYFTASLIFRLSFLTQLRLLARFTVWSHLLTYAQHQAGIGRRKTSPFPVIFLRHKAYLVRWVTSFLEAKQYNSHARSIGSKFILTSSMNFFIINCLSCCIKHISKIFKEYFSSIIFISYRCFVCILISAY